MSVDQFDDQANEGCALLWREVFDHDVLDPVEH